MYTCKVLVPCLSLPLTLAEPSLTGPIHVVIVAPYVPLCNTYYYYIVPGYFETILPIATATVDRNNVRDTGQGVST